MFALANLGVICTLENEKEKSPTEVTEIFGDGKMALN